MNGVPSDREIEEIKEWIVERDPQIARILINAYRLCGIIKTEGKKIIKSVTDTRGLGVFLGVVMTAIYLILKETVHKGDKKKILQAIIDNMEDIDKRLEQMEGLDKDILEREEKYWNTVAG